MAKRPCSGCKLDELLVFCAPSQPEVLSSLLRRWGVPLTTLGVQDLLIPDRIITDAQGRKLNFQREILQQGPVLISFIFTRCQKSCPLIAKV